MKLTLNFVNHYIDLKDVPLTKIIYRLVEGGFEVEEIIENNSNIILDISAPTNRVESLSINGMIKELGYLLDKPFKLTTTINNDFKKWANKIDKQTEKKLASDYYTSFFLFKIENLQSTIIPDWIKRQLINSGIEPQNNLLDYRNYILLETGYPFEFYDLRKIQKHTNTDRFKINFLINEENEKDQEANTKSKFIASNNEIYDIPNSTLMLKTDNNISLSIAGLISHKSFSCTMDTNSFMVEASVFNSKFIRNQSKLTNCRTDRSIRYEKNISSNNLLHAYYRLVELLKENNPNLDSELYKGTNEIEIKDNRKILLKYSKLLKTIEKNESDFYSMKYSLTPKHISNYLDRLKFSYIYDKLNLTWFVTVPDYYPKQIHRQIHLIQEIIRLHGFNRFPNLLPSLKIPGRIDKSYTLRKILKTYFLANGMSEQINYSTISSSNFLTYENFKIINPVNSDQSKLRSTLLPNIINVLIDNKQNGNKILSAFENGHVFRLNSNSEIYNEFEYITGIYCANKSLLNEWLEDKHQLVWENFKELFIKLFNQLNVEVIWETNTNLNSEGIEKLFNPKRVATLKLLNKKTLAVIGQIHPNLKKNFPVNTFLFELNFDFLLNQYIKNKFFPYVEYVKYPVITRYLTFHMRKNISFQFLQNFIKVNGSKYLKHIILISHNKHKFFENQIHYKFSLIFQSKKTTLSNEKITSIMNTLENKLGKLFNM